MVWPLVEAWLCTPRALGSLELFVMVKLLAEHPGQDHLSVDAEAAWIVPRLWLPVPLNV